ncbi:tripartite tricarboxylate transporter permease [Limnochorda pilosa]|uniref:Transporter n=1 Tax=Limnochorda pilosa TaxID=1555112 RepID=A0A0K2SH51_LIMPI|nr:tripartite tricarboxylate transporter permease [Limnochorda pilosa]BAS26362.1 transporter [Limnochorda pilosa]
MEMVQNLIGGFATILSPGHVGWLLAGQLMGLLVGILPGVNASMGVAVLLPVIYGMGPLDALSFLIGIYFSAMIGGGITSILFGVPGTSTSAVLALDGHELARQGRGARALGLMAFGSWMGGTLGLVFLTALGPAIAAVALAFGPAEYFALMFFGLTLISALAADSPIKGLIAGLLGLLAGTVGIDPVSGVSRYTFGSAALLDGIEFIPVLVGLFAVSQVLVNVEKRRPLARVEGRLSGSLPSREDLRETRTPLVRGALIGSLVGALPGAGATVASFLSYAVEKTLSRKPQLFGKGALPGVAGPSAADNGAASTALIPLLTLGIPGSETTAVLVGALMILGIRPGPLLFTQQTELVWALFASLYLALIAGASLAIVGAPWLTQVLRVPAPILSAFILSMAFIGSYSVNNSMTDVWVMAGAGLIGYAMRKLDFPVAPVVLALVLGPMVEENFRQALLTSAGDPLVFLYRPISAALLLLAAVGVFVSLRMQARLRMQLRAGVEREAGSGVRG